LPNKAVAAGHVLYYLVDAVDRSDACVVREEVKAMELKISRPEDLDAPVVVWIIV
jgi:hypothetical protein